MKKLILLMLCACLFACSKNESFTGRIQFQLAMPSQEWPEFLDQLKLIVPNDKYTGKDVEIDSTKGMRPFLYARKMYVDKRYLVTVMQREGKPKLSFVFSVSDSCTQCADWEKESDRIEAILRLRYGERLTVNRGAISEISF